MLCVGAGQERPVSLSAGGFLLPALRTGRAASTASGSAWEPRAIVTTTRWLTTLRIVTMPPCSN